MSALSSLANMNMVHQKDSDNSLPNKFVVDKMSSHELNQDSFVKIVPTIEDRSAT
jgi:hypothetical protein